VHSNILKAILFALLVILGGISTIYSQGLNTGILAMKVSFPQALLVGTSFIIFGIWILLNAYKMHKKKEFDQIIEED